MCVSSSCGHPGPTIKGGSFSPNAREEQHGVALTAAAAPGPSKMAFLSLGTKPLPVTRARGCAIRCFCWLQIVCMTASPTHPRALGPRTQRDSVTATCPSAEMEAGRLGGGVGVATEGPWPRNLSQSPQAQDTQTGLAWLLIGSTVRALFSSIRGIHISAGLRSHPSCSISPKSAAHGVWLSAWRLG
jgi:hypothetical protein